MIFSMSCTTFAQLHEQPGMYRLHCALWQNEPMKQPCLVMFKGRVFGKHLMWCGRMEYFAFAPLCVEHAKVHR